MDLNEIRKAAGIPLVESEMEDPNHEAAEKKLFHTTASNLGKVAEMCTHRLAEKDLSPEHKSQYATMKKEVSALVAAMLSHLDTYK
jgi:hypothetical protein